jgi:acyl phosphate:glycerol-3-phosphate acyltransferase
MGSLIVKEIITVFISYLIGSFPTAYIFGLVTNKKDIRDIGTKNMGALNAFQSLGPFYGIITFFIDGCKGYFPVYFAIRENFNFIFIGLCAISVLCGHNWSIFLKFHGGKGGSTSSGIILALFPRVFLFVFFVFIFLSVLTNNVTFGLGFCFLFLPVIVYFSSYSKYYFFLSFLIPFLGLIRIFPYFFRMIVESNGNFNKMLTITLHGFHRFEKKKGDK